MVSGAKEKGTAGVAASRTRSRGDGLNLMPQRRRHFDWIIIRCQALGGESLDMRMIVVEPLESTTMHAYVCKSVPACCGFVHWIAVAG